MAVSAKYSRTVERQPPRFITYNDLGENYIGYGEDNGYPTMMERMLHASPSGVACRNKLVEFLVGRGFENEDFNSLVVNRKNETLNDILLQLSQDVSDFNSWHLHIVYNLNLDIDSIVRINPEYVRKSSPDSFGFSPRVVIYNNWYMDNWTRAEASEYMKYEVDVFNPNKDAIKSQIELAGSIRNWNGQVFSYWGGAPIYPKTIYDSVKDDLETDSLLSSKNKVDLKKGYMAATAAVFKNKLTQDERDAVFASLLEVQGADGNRIALIDGAEDGMELQSVNTNFSDGQFTLTEARVRRAIFRVFGQLPILHGEDRANAISADGKAIEMAFELYNHATLRKRTTLSECISKIMKNFKTPIDDPFIIEPMTFRQPESKEVIEVIEQ